MGCDVGMECCWVAGFYQTTVIYPHTHIHRYTHTEIHAYTHTHIHTYIHTHTHTYIHAYIHTCPLRKSHGICGISLAGFGASAQEWPTECVWAWCAGLGWNHLKVNVCFSSDACATVTPSDFGIVCHHMSSLWRRKRKHITVVFNTLHSVISHWEPQNEPRPNSQYISKTNSFPSGSRAFSVIIVKPCPKTQP